MKRGIALFGTALALGTCAFALPSNTSATSLPGSITLGQDVEDCYTIESGNVVFDLNGHNVTCATGHAFTVSEGATLTIKGNGAVTASQGAVTNLGGTVTINGGTYVSTNWYTVKNMGTMTIVNGTFGQDTAAGNPSNASLVVNGWANGNGVSGDDAGYAHSGSSVATMTIEGGSFQHLVTNTSTIKSDDYSKTTINNGNYVSANGTLIQATGDVTVNNGTFKGFNSLIVFNADGTDPYEPGRATIKNGTFDAKYIAWNSAGGTLLDIQGGTFTNFNSVYSSWRKATTTKFSGGTFNINVSSYIVNGMHQNSAGTIVANEVTPTVNPSITDNGVSVAPTNANELKAATTEALKSIIAAEHTSDATVYISAKDADTSSLSEEVQAEIAKQLSANGLTAAGALDITVNYTAGTKSGTISDLSAPITLTATLPTSLPAVANGYLRTYAVIRIHDGAAEVIPATLSADGKTLTFQSDKFSTFVLTYKDTKNATTNTNTTTTSTTVKAPNTGANATSDTGSLASDSSVFALLATVATLAGAAVIARRASRR